MGLGEEGNALMRFQHDARLRRHVVMRVPNMSFMGMGMGMGRPFERVGRYLP
jgi:hypothetical protein